MNGRTLLPTKVPWSVDAVILSIPGRESQLQQCIESVQDVVDRIILVWNSESAPPVIRSSSCYIEVRSAFYNLGVSKGRNFGVEFSNADLVLFIDDDALLETRFEFRSRCEKMILDRSCIVTTFKVLDENRVVERQHDPRLFKSQSFQSRFVGTFLGGACLVRRDSFAAIGGFFEELTYGMEEWDLSLRAHNLGYRIFFDCSVVLFHPARNAQFSEIYWTNIFTNRMIVARRNLGLPSRVFHLTIRFILLATTQPLLTAFSIAFNARKNSKKVSHAGCKPIRIRTHLKFLKLRRPAFL